MPRFDGTGPQGKGPLTGGGFGPCGDDGADGRTDREVTGAEVGGGRRRKMGGRGRCLGNGRGWANRRGPGLGRGYGGLNARLAPPGVGPEFEKLFEDNEKLKARLEKLERSKEG